MSCAPPYMRLWVDDFLADITELGLTDEELGVYFRLLLVAWKKEGIPADLNSAARHVSSSAAKLRKLWPVIEEKWVSDGNGKLVNPKQEKEREYVLGLSDAGKAGAEARWRKRP